MFDVGDTKEKALLAMGCSLGWEISAALKLEKEFLKSLIARAKSEGQRFIYFTDQRKKTAALRFGVLNPLARERLDKWLADSEAMKLRERKKENR